MLKPRLNYAWQEKQWLPNKKPSPPPDLGVCQGNDERPPRQRKFTTEPNTSKTKQIQHARPDEIGENDRKRLYNCVHAVQCQSSHRRVQKSHRSTCVDDRMEAPARSTRKTVHIDNQLLPHLTVSNIGWAYDQEHHTRS